LVRATSTFSKIFWFKRVKVDLVVCANDEIFEKLRILWRTDSVCVVLKRFIAQVAEVSTEFIALFTQWFKKAGEKKSN